MRWSAQSCIEDCVGHVEIRGKPACLVLRCIAIVRGWRENPISTVDAGVCTVILVTRERPAWSVCAGVAQQISTSKSLGGDSGAVECQVGFQSLDCRTIRDRSRSGHATTPAEHGCSLSSDPAVSQGRRCCTRAVGRRRKHLHRPDLPAHELGEKRVTGVEPATFSLGS